MDGRHWFVALIPRERKHAHARRLLYGYVERMSFPGVDHMIDSTRQILSLVWNWMALRSAGFYYTRVVNGAGLYLICCLDHTSFGFYWLLWSLCMRGIFGHARRKLVYGFCRAAELGSGDAVRGQRGPSGTKRSSLRLRQKILM